MLPEYLTTLYAQDREKTASRAVVDKLKTLPLDELFKIANGDETSKIACAMSSIGPGDGSKSWLDGFRGTPLFEQAVALERKSLELEAADQEQRQLSQQAWSQRDALSLQRRMLEIDLATQGSGGGGGAGPAAPPAMVPPEQKEEEAVGLLEQAQAEEQAAGGGGDAAHEATEDAAISQLQAAHAAPPGPAVLPAPAAAAPALKPPAAEPGIPAELLAAEDPGAEVDVPETDPAESLPPPPPAGGAPKGGLKPSFARDGEEGPGAEAKEPAEGKGPPKPPQKAEGKDEKDDEDSDDGEDEKKDDDKDDDKEKEKGPPKPEKQAAQKIAAVAEAGRALARSQLQKQAADPSGEKVRAAVAKKYPALAPSKTAADIRAGLEKEALLGQVVPALARALPAAGKAIVGVAPKLGPLGGAATRLGTAVTQGGVAGGAKSLGRMGMQFAQKNPLAAAGIAGGVGLAAGRMTGGQ